MRFLVTGLCLSRNLGGPAMGITLVNELKRRYPAADFVFAIDAPHYAQEKEWADHYGLEVVRRADVVGEILDRQPFRSVITLRRILKRRRPYCLANPEDERIRREFRQALAWCDAVINMMGISYVGDGGQGFFDGLSSYSNRYYATKMGKPYVQFVQSFGPFNEWRVRIFARRDLNQAPFVPARGRESARFCRSIVRDPDKVYDFPDIAILLPIADNPWVGDYLRKSGLSPQQYTILSPSSVIFNMPYLPGSSLGSGHVRAFALIAQKMLRENERLLFLPHKYSDDKAECDREVCFRILSMLEAEGHDLSRCCVVKDDIDVFQAKALIANARRAVVSRYHALVAAASTAIPVVTIGWNIKYFDLMTYYGIGRMAIDARRAGPEEIASEAFAMFSEYETGQFRRTMRETHAENAAKVHQAFDLLDQWIGSTVVLPTTG